MKKLTAEIARRDISHLKAFQKQPNIGLSLREETYLQALEIALPILEQQERGEGWIEWGGGEQPVADDVIVKVTCRGGDRFGPVSASHFEWEHYVPGPDDYDIIAYRIIPEQPTNPDKPLQVTIQEDTRSLAQNRMLWACLHDVSSQVVWYGRKLNPECWKHIFSASLKGQETVPGINGGFVVLGQSTSKMRVSEMRDLITLIHAFGAEQSVRFSDESARAAEWAGRFGSTS